MDTWSGDPEWPGDAPDPASTRAEFDRNTADIAFLEAIQTASVSAADRFQDRSVDWVFIDALHDYPSVKADITAWAPKVKEGGLVSGHDYGRASITDAVLRVYRDARVEHSIWMTREQPSFRPVRALKGELKHLLR